MSIESGWKRGTGALGGRGVATRRKLRDENRLVDRAAAAPSECVSSRALSPLFLEDYTFSV